MTDYVIWVKYVVTAEKATEAREQLRKAGLLETFLDFESWPKPGQASGKQRKGIGALIHGVARQVLGIR